MIMTSQMCLDRHQFEANKLLFQINITKLILILYLIQYPKKIQTFWSPLVNKQNLKYIYAIFSFFSVHPKTYRLHHTNVYLWSKELIKKKKSFDLLLSKIPSVILNIPVSHIKHSILFILLI